MGNDVFFFCTTSRHKDTMAANDPRLNELLKWSIENSDVTRNDPTAPTGGSDLTPDVMAALMGGPSEADLMKAAIQVISSDEPEITLDDKLVAFDNFEQLIENLDNANNIANLGLWTPLLEQLKAAEQECRKMAAWCVGTAVQNNEKTQERLLAVGGLPHLVELATHENEPSDVRRKAIYALSSAVRNYQPSMDIFVEELGKRGQETEKIDAADMEAIDVIMNDLREKAKASAQ